MEQRGKVWCPLTHIQEVCKDRALERDCQWGKSFFFTTSHTQFLVTCYVLAFFLELYLY